MALIKIPETEKMFQKYKKEIIGKFYKINEWHVNSKN